MTKEIRTTIQKIEAGPGQRLLVVSDIHGHLNRLIRLLEKMNYGGNDILIIVGDLIEKGPESLRVVQYVMDLERQHPVYVSMGNVEQYRLQLLWRLLHSEASTGDAGKAAEKERQEFAGYLHWAEKYWGNCLFQEMLADLGISVSQVTAENVLEHMSKVTEHFKNEIEFLWSRPTIMTAGEYLFVHGGVPTDDLSLLAETDAIPYLKNNDFWNQGYSFKRYTVVVGHWPTGLYRPNEENLSPLFDGERRIICIDGGCGLKYAGQLNGIMIPDGSAKMEEITWTWYDDFKTVTALDAQSVRAAGVHVQYFDSEVEVLKKYDSLTGGGENTGEMVHVRQVSSGKEFDAPLAWVHRWDDGRLHCSDYCDERLKVEPGEKLSVILQTEKDGLYVKNSQGKIGWYKGAICEA